MTDSGYILLDSGHEESDMVPEIAAIANRDGRPWVLFGSGLSIVYLPLETPRDQLSTLAVSHVQENGPALSAPNEPVDWALEELEEEGGWIAHTTDPNWKVYVEADGVVGPGPLTDEKVLRNSFASFRNDFFDQEPLATSD